MKTDYKHIYIRTRQMLTQPAVTWPEVLKENSTVRNTFRSYLFPIAIVLSVFIFLLRLIYYTPLQALGFGIVNFIAATSGAWFTYLITREYLCNKLNYPDHAALNLTIYSYTIFIIFHSIGGALENIFIGQIFTLLSLIFLRTLYTGAEQLQQLQANHKTNILIITFLSIVFIPVIITQILMIVFRISVINV